MPIADTSIVKQHIVLEGDIPSAINPPPGCPFQTRCRCKSHVPGNLCETRGAGTARDRAGHHSKCHLTPDVSPRMKPVISFAAPKRADERSTPTVRRPAMARASSVRRPSGRSGKHGLARKPSPTAGDGEAGRELRPHGPRRCSDTGKRSRAASRMRRGRSAGAARRKISTPRRRSRAKPATSRSRSRSGASAIRRSGASLTFPPSIWRRRSARGRCRAWT